MWFLRTLATFWSLFGILPAMAFLGTERSRVVVDHYRKALDDSLAETEASLAWEDEPEPPPGRVRNISQWLTWSDQSLKLLAMDQKGGLYDRVNAILQKEEPASPILTTPRDLHLSKRFAILSHGNQSDPVYNYVNAAGFRVFQWPAALYHRLPSRFSAPDGADRQRRAVVIQSATQASNITYIDEAVRVRYPNATVTLKDAVLWNVYDNDGVRVGQTVLFDADAVVVHAANATDWDYELADE